MSSESGPNLVTNGLVLCLDAANPLSYKSGATVWNDLTYNTSGGTLTNGPTFSTTNGGSIVFDGVNDFIVVPNSPIFTVNEFTVAMWFISKKDVDNYLLTKVNDSWYVGIGPSGQISKKLSFFVEGTSGGWLQTNTLINQNQWYYGVCTFKSNTSTIYVNGTLDISGTRVGSVKNGTETVFIGHRADGSKSYLLGNVANTQIYNRALTPSEILQNYNATKSRFGL
jgi:hypothetical protein